MRKLLLTSLLIFSLIGNCWADGNDANTVSLLHMDGADASTTFTDDAAGGTHTWTAQSNAQIDTAQSKFGGASGLFALTDDSITTPDSADFAFGADPFTIDFWIRFNTLPSDTAGKIMGLYDQYDLGTDAFILIDIRNISGANRVIFAAHNGTDYMMNYYYSATIVVNTWYHFEFVRNGTSVYIFQDGVSQTLTEGTAVSTNSMPDCNASVAIGEELASANREFDGWLDEYRISKGVARHTSNFTPPTEEYSADEVAAPLGQIIWVE